LTACIISGFFGGKSIGAATEIAECADGFEIFDGIACYNNGENNEEDGEYDVEVGNRRRRSIPAIPAICTVPIPVIIKVNVSEEYDDTTDEKNEENAEKNEESFITSFNKRNEKFTIIG
jgi:hypothetical protein